MAKKRADQAKPPEPIQGQPDRPVRLTLPAAEFAKVERCARRVGLTKAAYARMAVIRQAWVDEPEGTRL